jgi:PAS domain S-box-containing protein
LTEVAELLQSAFHGKNLESPGDPLLALTEAAAAAPTLQEFWQRVVGLVSALAGGGRVRVTFADETTSGAVEAGAGEDPPGETVNVEWREGDRFAKAMILRGGSRVARDQVLSILKSAATLADLVDRRAKLELERRRGTFLVELSRWMSAGAGDPKTLLRYTLQSAMNMALAQAALVAVKSSVTGGQVAVAAVGAVADARSDALQLTKDALQAVFSNGEPLFIPRIEERCKEVPASLKNRFGPAMVVPCRAGEVLRGALCVLRAADAGGFETDDATYLDIAASHIAGGLELLDAIESARQAAQRAKAMVEGSPLPMTLLSADGSILQINDATVELLGVEDKEAVIGQKVTALPLAVTTRQLKEALDNAQSGMPWRGRVDLARGDDVRLCELVVTPLTEGGPGELLLAINDRTEELHARRTQEKRQRVSQVGEASKNPLAKIRMEAEFLGLGAKEGEARAVESIIREVDRAAEIAQDLLRITQKPSGSAEQVQVNDLLQEILEVRSKAARPKPIKFRAQLAQKLPTVMALAADLQQAFANLVTNAEEAVSSEKKREILVETAVADGGIRIRISDSGPGVKEADRTQIFEPFFTTKDTGSQTDPRSGTGLGLPLTKRVVSELGGKVWVEDSDLGGARFVIELPGERSPG